MREKDMVNDVLTSINSSLTTYANAIAESENQQLRQTLQQMRNGDEQFQFQLSQAAMQKGWYHPADKANPQDIQHVKSQLSSS
jgi:spore coat protein CotF